MLVGRSLLVARIAHLWRSSWRAREIACLCISAAASGDNWPGAPAVILISVDTLRADHLSCYGYTGLRTPHIDSLAQGGTLFAEISSQAPITLPSHVSLFTSTFAFANGIRENAEVLPSGAVTLATVLAAHGYETAAFIGGYFLARRFGLASGFQTYDSPFDAQALKGALDLKRPAARVLTGAQRWIEQRPGSPFLLFVHLFDLHQPYDPPAAYRARAPGNEYDQELAYVDDSLGAFFEFLARLGLDRTALVILFSDHGESLGEHGESTHGYFIYRSTLHVPLIVHWPQTASHSFQAHVEAPAALIDVAPTVLNFLGIQAPASFCGHSLLDLARGQEVPPQDVYSESWYAHDKFGWATLRSLRRGDYQYIDAPHPELYDLKSDPRETHNLLASQAALAASYRQRLLSLEETYRPAPSATVAPAAFNDPGTTESLRSLGYLEITAPHGAALDDSRVDPKDRLFEYKRYLLAERLVQTGKAVEAVAELQGIVADDPQNVAANIELGRADIALRRYVEAANQLKAALALDPRNVEAEELLGDIWLSLGHLERAAAEFNHLLTFAPQDYEAHFGLGLVAARAGRVAEATEQFRAALAANPRSAEAHYQLGLMLEAQLQTKGARKEFQAALEIAPHYKDAQRAMAKLGASNR